MNADDVALELVGGPLDGVRVAGVSAAPMKSVELIGGPYDGDVVAVYGDSPEIRVQYRSVGSGREMLYRRTGDPHLYAYVARGRLNLPNLHG